MDSTVTAAILSAIAGIIVAILVNGVGWLLVRSQRSKTDAEAADVITESALKLVKQLEKKVAALEEKLETQEGVLRAVTQLNAQLLRGTAILTEQITDLGHEPCWTLQDASGEDDELRLELRRLQDELD